MSTRPSNFDEAFPSDYMKSDHITHDVDLTITEWLWEEIGREDNRQHKLVLAFEETPMKLVLNKTNGRVVSELYGKDFDAWVDKPITLFRQQIDFRGESVWAIRVRKEPPEQKEQSQPIPPPPDEFPEGAEYAF